MIQPYRAKEPFRFWCQKVLPLVYDDSLSYYEMLCRVIDYLNTMVNNVNAVGDAFNKLQEYVQNYFDDLDVQQEIDNKLDEMAEDGTLSDLIEPLVGSAVSDWLEDNVTPTGSAVIVDSSLSISGAAADAKVTGDEISDLKSDFSGKSETFTTPSGESTKNFEFPIHTNTQYSFTNNSGSACTVRLYKSDGTFITINGGLANGSTHKFYSPSSEYVSVGGYFYSSTAGSVTISFEGALKDISNKAEQSSLGNVDMSTLFEIGTIDITSNGWQYGPSNARVRTKKGVTLHLKAGTKVGLTDYTDVRFAAGLKTGNGTYAVYSWRTEDFTTISEGDYVFVIAYSNDAPVADKTDLSSLFFGYQAVAFDYINNMESDIDALSKVYANTESGFINILGSIEPSDSTQVVYTEKIPTNYNDVFYIDLKYGTPHEVWAAYALYDSSGRFISDTRIVFYRSVTLPEVEASVKVTNQNAKYIAFTYRTYGDCDASIMCASPSRLLKDNINTMQEMYGLSDVNKNITSICHRGYSTVAPENTIPAFKLARKMGFEWVETDVQFTSDRVPVILHDETINRTARNEDGTTISDTIRIDSITYEQALSYDFGIWKGDEYAGTKIPTFAQFLALCRAIGIRPFIELKDGGDDDMATLVDIVKSYGMQDKVVWTSFSLTLLRYIRNLDESASLSYIVSIANGGITDTIISNAESLRTGKNKVVINSDTYTSTEVERCKNAGFPLLIWTINFMSTAKNADPYISGITSDKYVFGYELYKDAMM